MISVTLTSIILVLVLTTASGSLVVDSISQKGVYVSDYCPTMKYCVEASHVMCMYYDPHSIMGPRCSNPQNVSITAELANQLLDVTNAIRSKIATGKETGKDGALLPRGFGIFRLRWDNELATFAQVLANQCVLRHDLCRATKRFPDPGQTAGLVRFTFPEWYPMSRTPATSSPGLNDMKLSYAVTQTLKSWYAQKAMVTEQMLKNYPDWTLTPTNQGGRLYLEMIFGATTHMGCGISAYTEYSYYDNNRQMNYNSIQVICNYSSRPRKGGQSYNTDAPVPGHGYTSLCGCPEGSREDADCLCNEYRPPPKLKPRAETCSSPEGNCEPTLVLLPIFTVEDAPPEKLYEKAKQIEEPLANFVMSRLDNMSSIGRTKSAEVFDFFDDAEKEHTFRQAPMPHPIKTVLMPSLPAEDLVYRAPGAPPALPTLAPQLPLLPTPRAPYPILPTPRAPHSSRHQQQPVALPLPLPPAPPPQPEPTYHEALRSHYEKNLFDEEQRRVPPVPRQLPKHSPTIKKSSIFTRVAQFKLPGRKSMSSPFETIKKDVVPRKDFSNLNKVVNDYLNRRTGFRRSNVVKPKIDEVPHPEHVEEPPHTEPPKPEPPKEEQKQQQTQHLTTEENITREEKPRKEEAAQAVLNNVEEKVMNYNRYLKQRGSNSTDDTDAKDENDNKLMSLLDTLEREVKHIELDGNEKELFDAKIRKIYGTVVGKPVELLSTKLIKANELEILDSDFGESKTYVKHDSNHLSEDERISDDDRKSKHSEKSSRIKNYDFLDHKHKDKIPDILDHNKYNDNIDHKLFNEIDRKYNENIDHKYDNSDHKYTDLENKYMDDLDRKFNDDHKYNDKHKFIDKYENFDDDRKYGVLPAARNQVKYEKEPKSYKLNALNSLEDVKYRNYDKYNERDSKTGRERSAYRVKDADRKHRRGSETKRSKSKAYYTHPDPNDPLSIERRKYYQDKLENLERRLHNSRSFRRKMEHGNERPMRRMRPSRDDPMRSRSKADNFYMPDRARFLHGF